MNRDELEVDFFQVTKYLLVWRIGPEDWRREVLGDYTFTLLSTNSGYSKDGDFVFDGFWLIMMELALPPPKKESKVIFYASLTESGVLHLIMYTSLQFTE